MKHYCKSNNKNQLYHGCLQGDINFENTISNNWINILKIKNKKISFLKVIKHLKKYQIECRPIWFPLHLQKFCKDH